MICCPWSAALWWKEHWCLMGASYLHLVSDNNGRNVISFDTFEIAGRRKKEKERSKFVLNDQKSRKKSCWKCQGDQAGLETQAERQDSAVLRPHSALPEPVESHPDYLRVLSTCVCGDVDLQRQICLKQEFLCSFGLKHCLLETQNPSLFWKV